MNSFLKRSGALACAALTISSLQGETNSAEAVGQLDKYTVSAGPRPLAISEYSSPITVLEAPELSQGPTGTLGSVLDWQPGVNASSFTAGASRPVLRGFAGPRVRILNSGTESIDVSDTSPDHGVAIEPLLTERVEILRGPSTLLYGSAAIGGVVNVVGREIPRQPGTGKVEGAVEVRHDTVSHGETALGYATFGTENWAISLTGLKRDNNDYKIPGDAEKGHHDDHGHGKLENSFVETDSFSGGASWFFTPNNYLGFSYSGYNSLYGVPSHGHDDDHDDDITIDLERKRFDTELQLLDVSDLIDGVRVRFGYTDYKHAELEDDEVEAVFTRKGWELRAEASHTPIGIFDQGIFGAQINDTDLSIDDHHAEVELDSTTRSQAVFISEHIHRDRLHYEFGARVERQTVSAVEDDERRKSYSDVALSVATGIIWDVNETNSLALSLQRSQRHPNSLELYMDGHHLATQQDQIGDEDLGLETAYGVDLTWRTNQAAWNSSVSIFYTYFDDYIFANPTGGQRDDDGNSPGDLGFDPDHALDTYAFTAVDAHFYGFEAEIEFILHRTADTEVRLGFMTDYVRAKNRDSGDNLPRIPPLRVGSHLGLSHGTWDAGLELRYAFSQNKTAPEETSTDGYTELNLSLSKSFLMDGGRALTLFARASNLLDEEIRHHTSFLKDEAPLPGRNFTVGGRFEF